MSELLHSISVKHLTVPHELLLTKLQAYGVSKPSIQLIRNFLTKRRQRVKIFDKTSDWVETIGGIPQGSVLRPLLFNIFVNDLHFDLTNGEINTFADDNQLYTCHQNADTVEDTLNSDLEITLEWFHQNSLTANPNKFQSLGLAPGRSTIDLQVSVLGNLVQQLSFIKLLGVTLDNKLNFHVHIANLCRKVGRQVGVLNRLKRLVPVEARIELYNSFILTHLNYCSTVWHFCRKGDSDKLEKLNERALRTVFQDKSSSYETLLNQARKTTLYNRRMQDIAILIYKALHNQSPQYIKELFKLRISNYNLRGTDMLILPRFNTVTYGKNSLRYMGPKIWNSLPDDIKAANNIATFKKSIRKFNFNFF